MRQNHVILPCQLSHKKRRTNESPGPRFTFCSSLSSTGSQTESFAQSFFQCGGRKLPPELLDELKYHDLYLSGEDAVKFGLADGHAEFAPPLGTHVFNVLG